MDEDRKADLLRLVKDHVADHDLMSYDEWDTLIDGVDISYEEFEWLQDNVVITVTAEYKN